MVRGGVMSKNLLEMAPRTGQLAKKMFGNAHYVFAEKPSAKVRPSHCQIIESLREWLRVQIATARSMKEVQATESAQLVLQVAETLRDGERIRERGAHLRSLGGRCAQGGVQPHLRV